MALAKQLGHHVIDNMALPYVTNDNPTSTDLMYTGGVNVMTSLRGLAERRPGFADALEPVPTTFSGTVQRLHGWRRWDDAASGATRGAFIVLLNEVTATASNVYKLQIGTDTSFVLIHSSSAVQPFDFVTANNYVYFGNGSDMLKYDGTTVNKWGIHAPSGAPVVTRISSPPASTAESSRPSGSTNSDAFTSPEAAYDGTLSAACTRTVANDTAVKKCTWFGFPSLTGTPSVITLKVNWGFTSNTQSSPPARGTIYYSKDGGATFVQIYNQTFTSRAQTTDQVDLYALGVGTDLSAIQVRAEVLNQHEHSVTISVAEIWIDATCAINTNTFNLNSGFAWCSTYGSSTSGHESSPSLLTPSTGVVGAIQFNLDVVASDNPEVDQIRIYRNPDGGAIDPSLMQEITGSPFPNATATLYDATKDVDLGTRTGPPLYRNDPPKPGIGFVRSTNGRIYYFSGNKVYFTGREEIGNGVREECVPGGLDGNYESYASEVTGVATMDVDGTSSTVVYQANAIEYIQGDTLDSFRFGNVMKGRGTRNHLTIGELGNAVEWFDTSAQDWMSGVNELGVYIRPDLQAIDQSTAARCIYVSGKFHHTILMDGARGLLFVYDFDTSRWLPPWDVGNCTAIASIEIALGQRALLIARNGKVLKQTPNSYNDDGAPYPAWAATNLHDLTPKENPSLPGIVDHVAIETDLVVPAVEQLTDDVPLLGSYEAMEQIQDGAPKRTQGAAMNETWFTLNTPEARKASFRFTWPTEDRNFNLYSLAVGYRQAGT